MSIRLNKFLANAGLGSRRKVEDLIFAGLVSINGKTISTPATFVEEKDSVKVNNKLIRQENKIYFILNKPKKFLCSATRKINEKLVIDLFANYKEKLFTVGRLDKDTTGLLIVTNDGDLSNKIIHPSANIEKEYIAKTKEDITSDHLIKISKGAFIENRYVKPKKVFKVRKGTVKIIVKEGKKREVKQFIMKADLTLVDLKRVRIGNLLLGNLRDGEYKEVLKKDLECIFEKNKVISVENKNFIKKI